MSLISYPTGGTCVNAGCVPKKVMFNTVHVKEVIDEAKHFGFKVGEVSFDWNTIKTARDNYIHRLNNIYKNNLDNQKITSIQGFAHFDGVDTVRVGKEVYKSKHILIATGGAPNKLGVPGEEHVLDSDGFFALEHQPKKVGVIGAGYIAVELAGVFNGLGSETKLFVRHNQALRNFDSTLRNYLDESLKKSGIEVVPNAGIKSVTKETDGTFTLHLLNGQV